MSLHEWMLLAGLGGAIFLGTSTQRVTGVGFALVSSPLLVALLGPFDGILVVNVFGTLTAFAVFWQVRSQVEYARAARMLVPALVAIIPGAWVARAVRPDILSVIIGVLVIAALVGSFFAQPGGMLSNQTGAALAGAVSGFMNVTAGVGGPAVSAYAVASRWPQTAFAATAQLYFFVLGLVSLLAKQALPNLGWPQITGCLVAVVAGIVVGDRTSRRLPQRVAGIGVIAIAFVGSALILIRGAVDWVGY